MQYIVVYVMSMDHSVVMPSAKRSPRKTNKIEKVEERFMLALGPPTDMYT
jgi:hypothetical protein